MSWTRCRAMMPPTVVAMGKGSARPGVLRACTTAERIGGRAARRASGRRCERRDAAAAPPRRDARACRTKGEGSEGEVGGERRVWSEGGIKWTGAEVKNVAGLSALTRRPTTLADRFESSFESHRHSPCICLHCGFECARGGRVLCLCVCVAAAEARRWEGPGAAAEARAPTAAALHRDVHADSSTPSPHSPSRAALEYVFRARPAAVRSSRARGHRPRAVR